MRRIKVVSEPTDLVPILRAFDADLKRDVFQHLIDEWLTAAAIEEKYGQEGLDALALFEKTKLVETKWDSEGGKTVKAYRSYYTSFNISMTAAVQELAEILAVASMDEAHFMQIDDEIAAMVGKEGFSARAISEKLDIPLTRLKSLLKRSSRLEFKGHIIKRML